MLYNPFDPEVLRNPYPILNRLREEGPLHWNSIFNMWMVTKYDDVKLLYMDGRLSSERMDPAVKRMEKLLGQDLTLFRNNLANWILFLDSPRHAWIRGMVFQALKLSSMKSLSSMVESVATELLKQLPSRFDFVSMLAYPLPVIVISRLLGVPKEDQQLMKSWSKDLVRILAHPSPTKEEAKKGHQSLCEFTLYFKDLILERRKHRREDVISRLVDASADGKSLSQEELVATCTVLLFGGHETTTHLLGNGILQLLNHPEQLSKLIENPDLLENAVEEILRFEPPVQWTSRTAKEEMMVHGEKLPPGQGLMLMIASANRDPSSFDQPESFWIERFPNKHLSFGHGAHFCVGAQLARLEALVAFKYFIRDFSKARMLDLPLVWKSDVGFRGLESLLLEN